MRRTHHDRWLLSYADFVTLLFAAFVVFYAASKAKAHAQPGNTHKSIQQTAILSDLQRELGNEQANGAVVLSQDNRGAVISLNEQICFGAGMADVQEPAKPMLEKVARILSRYPNKLLLIGHTDSQPIHNQSFRSNWELSTARGISVMLLLQGMAPLDSSRFLIEGAADNKPISDNATDQGRAKNRRVEIVALFDSADPGHK